MSLNRDIQTLKNDAATGDVTAYFELGLRFKTGHDVKEDIQKALACFHYASNDEKACDEIVALYKEKKGQPLSTYYAALLRNDDAQNDLMILAEQSPDIFLSLLQKNPYDHWDEIKVAIKRYDEWFLMTFYNLLISVHDKFVEKNQNAKQLSHSQVLTLVKMKKDVGCILYDYVDEFQHKLSLTAVHEFREQARGLIDNLSEHEEICFRTPLPIDEKLEFSCTPYPFPFFSKVTAEKKVLPTYDSFQFTEHFVNLDKPPPRIVLLNNQELTLGDLHGNPLKILYALIGCGAIQLRQPLKDYLQFVECVKVLRSIAQSAEDEDNDEPALYTSVKSSLQQIVTLLEGMTFHPEALSKLRLIGDVLCDRNGNDYVTLLLIAHIRNHLPVEIIFSNHDSGFLCAIQCQKFFPYTVNTGQHISDPWLWVTVGDGIIQRVFVSVFDNSLAQLAYMSGMLSEIRPNLIHTEEDKVWKENPIVSFKAIEQLTDDYKRRLKLLTYSISPGRTLPVFTLFTHAPSNLMTVKKLADYYKVEYKDDIPSELSATIDSINHAFVTDICSPESSNIKHEDISTYYPGSGISRAFTILASCLNDFVNNRTPLELSIRKHYKVENVHGHVGTDYVAPKGCCNLDSDFGKEPHIAEGILKVACNIANSPEFLQENGERRVVVR